MLKLNRIVAALAFTSVLAIPSAPSAAPLPTPLGYDTGGATIELAQRRGGGGGRSFNRGGGGRSFSGRSFQGRNFSGRSFQGRNWNGNWNGRWNNRPYRPYYNRGWGYPGWGVGAGILGFGLGAALANPYRYNYNYDYQYADDHVARCEARYRSYDPATDTFLGYDGLRHQCNL